MMFTPGVPFGPNPFGGPLGMGMGVIGPSMVLGQASAMTGAATLAYTIGALNTDMLGAAICAEALGGPQFEQAMGGYVGSIAGQGIGGLLGMGLGSYLGGPMGMIGGGMLGSLLGGGIGSDLARDLFTPVPFPQDLNPPGSFPPGHGPVPPGSYPHYGSGPIYTPSPSKDTDTGNNTNKDNDYPYTPPPPTPGLYGPGRFGHHHRHFPGGPFGPRPYPGGPYGPRYPGGPYGPRYPGGPYGPRPNPGTNPGGYVPRPPVPPVPPRHHRGPGGPGGPNGPGGPDGHGPRRRRELHF